MVSQSTGRLVFLLILVGNLGLQAELALLDHVDSTTQWIPHAVLMLGLLAIAGLAIRPGATSLTVFKVMMWIFILTGLLGVYFHLVGNFEFEVERNPRLSGFELLWESMRGATPALAPGALVQLGLLGLLFSYRYGPTIHTDSHS